MSEFDTTSRRGAASTSPAFKEHAPHWIGMHDEHVAGSDRSLSRLMRRLKRDGVPLRECAFRLVPPKA